MSKKFKKCSKFITKKCLCCAKEVEYIREGSGKIWGQELFMNAAYCEFVVGYGSDYDFDTLKFVICDECIKEKIKLKQMFRKSYLKGTK